jgi:L-lactate dehydrogenase complex protein LldF
MPKNFRSQVRSALANPVLQSALDANADKRITVRRHALESLPDHQALRRRAHQVRADVIANLDVYLDRFIERLQENGVQVHRAAGAEEACNIILSIAAKQNAHLIAKAKTMVSEEIHLNHALEQAGIQVVETDLGEYIVQLRQEPPSHIITPAVHLRRQEVGKTFHEKLGIPFTEDIVQMTAAARLELREVFLKADIGISGVNFGVIETGALCIVTNEGNGRMATTLPPVHIALMGIERLVPTLKDLALMLELLPRSATGQKLTVYVNLLHGPRRPGEVDGPRERHLVLVDNGRNALRKTELSEILYCIRCGACLNACPIFREIGGHGYQSTSGQISSYPGPIGSVVSPALFGQSEFGGLARVSSLCGACKEACPVDIDLPKLLLRVRAGKTHAPLKPRPNAPWGLKLGLSIFTRIATSAFLYRWALRSAGLFSLLISPRNKWLRLPAVTGWGYSKDFPRPAAKPFRDRWKDINNQADFNLGLPVSEPEEPVEYPLDQGNHPEGKVSSLADMAAQPTNEVVVETQAGSLLDSFTAEITALGGLVVTCSLKDLPARAVKLLQQKGISAIAAWEAAHLPAGLLETLLEGGVSVIHAPDSSALAGLTGSVAACAETGSLCVTSGVGRPLSASLLPEVHIAILKSSDIYKNLADFFENGGEKVDDMVKSAAAVWISGPSRTADIEMTLTIGVHGPKELIVFCLVEEV